MAKNILLIPIMRRECAKKILKKNYFTIITVFMTLYIILLTIKYINAIMTIIYLWVCDCSTTLNPKQNKQTRELESSSTAPHWLVFVFILSG